MSYPRFRRARAHKFVMGNQGGAITTGSTTFVDVAGGITALVLPAHVDDVLLCEFEAMVDSDSNGNYVALGFSFNGTDDTAHVMLKSIQNSGNTDVMHIFLPHTVVSGDISSGTVSVKARWRTNAGTATMHNENTLRRCPAFRVENIGPVAV